MIFERTRMRLGLDAPELQHAIAAVRSAVRVAERVNASVDTLRIAKEDLSPVTVADFAVQAIVAKKLSDAFSDMTLVGEEDSGRLRAADGEPVLQAVTGIVDESFGGVTATDVCDWIDIGGGTPSSRFWTLDPIDGTKGYLRGGYYAIALALVEDGEVRAGILGCPNFQIEPETHGDGSGSLAVAWRGGGAWGASLADDAEFARLSVSSCADPENARMLRSYESGHTNVSEVDALAETLGVGAAPVLMDSQAKYAALACGQAELLFRLLSPSQPDYKEKIWDQAAGSIVVEEAGGRVTDLDGRPLDFSQGRTLANNTGVCATNGHLHEPALEALRRLR